MGSCPIPPIKLFQEVVPMEESHVSIFPSCGKFQLEEGEGQREVSYPGRQPHCPRPPSAARACLPSLTPGQAQPRGSTSLGVANSTVHGGDKAPEFPRQQAHLPRPETTALASPLGKGVTTPHTIKIPTCKALLWSLTLQLKVD